MRIHVFNLTVGFQVFAFYWQFRWNFLENDLTFTMCRVALYWILVNSKAAGMLSRNVERKPHARNIIETLLAERFEKDLVCLFQLVLKTWKSTYHLFQPVYRATSFKFKNTRRKWPNFPLILKKKQKKKQLNRVVCFNLRSIAVTSAPSHGYQSVLTKLVKTSFQRQMG